MNWVVVFGVIITVATGIPVFMQLKRHPKGLFVLFFAEMWERFSYYGMRALLIFYLTQHFLFDDKFSSAQYGSYTTLVYLTPLIGGVLADRYLGTRKAILFGALLLVAGHFTMAIEGPQTQQSLTYGGHSYDLQIKGRGDDRTVKLLVAGTPYDFKAAGDGGIQVAGLPAGSPIPAVMAKDAYVLKTAPRDPFFVNAFYLALALIVMGVGFLKPNISTIVGQLYPQGDPRRDPGFTLFYFGINLGAFWASILCGLLGQTVGWWAGFGLAGLGMAAGFVGFILGKPLLEGRGEAPDPVRLTQKVAGPVNREGAIYGLGLLGVAAVWVLIRHNDLVGLMLGVGAAAVLLYIAFFLVTKCGKVERERTLLALVLTAGSVVFFTLFEQAGTSLNLFAERNTALVAINASQTQSFNAGFILIFAPIFATLWERLGRRGRDPSPMIKFGLGLAQVGLGFLLLVWGAQFHDAAYRLPMIFLAGAYLLHTTGELCLSPVGLSEITKLSPPAIVATLMAVWFLASSAAQYAGGFVAQLAGTETVGGQVLDPAKALATSIGVFQTIGWVGVGFGVLFLALHPLLSRWGHDVNNADRHG
jgi:POT family proton-dependent oligopeptide transporter